MSNINKVKTAIRVAQLNTLTISISTAYHANENIQNDAFLKQNFVTLDDYLKRLTVAIKKVDATSDLDEKDIARDNDETSLFSLIAGYCHFPDEETVKHASNISKKILQYKGITNQPYTIQSSWTESMLKDLEDKSIQDDIEALPGIKETIAKIRVSQTAFSQSRDMFLELDKNRNENASSLKKPILSIINDTILPYVSAMNMANSKKYGSFATKISSYVQAANEDIARQNKKATADLLEE